MPWGIAYGPVASALHAATPRHAATPKVVIVPLLEMLTGRSLSRM